MEESEFSLEDRVPCSDGACVGIIGENGVCGVCGKPYDGVPPLKFHSRPEENEPADLTGESGAGNDGDTGRAFDPNERVNCPDDMCVGIIGENGKCGICGKSS